jgi:KDO2-lipid IV(A) lauroyltransferase
VAAKQRIRAEETIKERLGYDDALAKATIKKVFINLAITFMEILYMPALNKDNIRGLVSIDRPDVLWDALSSRATAWSCWAAIWTTGNGWARPWSLNGYPTQRCGKTPAQPCVQ